LFDFSHISTRYLLYHLTLNVPEPAELP
jgi:hypothetical protein